mmetsp:Transcript_22900/g.54054  ORF Transcript_22900/g.54054 Transcript_22900/m.54054 type:complete len:195 (+) Transcript_22900:85-669(+)
MSYSDHLETVLETGHVLMHCKHKLEHCHQCCVDFRDMNADERRASAAKLSKKQAKRDEAAVVQKPCAFSKCDQAASNLCSRCRKVAYCSVDCQRKDWKARHKKECKTSLPSFVNSITKKKITSYPIGTTIEMVGGNRPLRAKIRKYNPPGSADVADPTASGLATYSLQAVAENDVWNEPCEDVHDKESWIRVDV